MTIATLLFFVCAVIGFTNILVDPATIAKPFRDKVEKWAKRQSKWAFVWKWFDKMLSCYQCTGFWVGIICGFIIISINPLDLFMCGVAGSFIATWGAYYLNYLEAQSVVLDR
jgi:hypothetical protein